MRQRWLLSLLALVGVALMWLGTQTVGEEHGADPRNKVLVAAWLETELWVDPWLVGVGVAIVIVAVVLLLVHRLRSLRSDDPTP